MAATQIGIVYSAATGRARRLIIPDADGQLGFHPRGAGEALLIVTPEQLAASNEQSLVTGATGLTPSNDRYAQIDGDGNVAAAHVLDFACNDHLLPFFSGFTLIAHPNAGPGWWRGSGRWHPPASIGLPIGVNLRRHLIRRK